MKSTPILLLSFLLTALAGPGQTSFMAIFTPLIQKDLNLSATRIGVIYSLATLSSAICLPFLGFWLKRYGYKKTISTIFLFFCMGGFALFLSKNIFFLYLGFACIRFSANGSFPVVSRAIIAISFEKARGKALSVSSLGFPAGEAIFPILASLLLGYMSWQKAWLSIAFIFLVLLFPVVFYLLQYLEKYSKHSKQKVNSATSTENNIHENSKNRKNYSVSEILREPSFYILLPAILYPPFILSGLFFYHGIFAHEKGWNLHHIAQGFLFYGGAQFVSILLSGPLIDRFSAKTMMYIHLLPILVGFSCFYIGMKHQWVYLYLALTGMTTGFGGNVKSALWPELYGVGDIEKILSMLTAIISFSTAIGPPITGLLLDHGIAPSRLLEVALVFGAVAQLLLFYALKRRTGRI